MCLLLVGITLRMAPIIDDMGEWFSFGANVIVMQIAPLSMMKVAALAIESALNMNDEEIRRLLFRRMFTYLFHQRRIIFMALGCLCRSASSFLSCFSSAPPWWQFKAPARPPPWRREDMKDWKQPRTESSTLRRQKKLTANASLTSGLRAER